MASGNVHTRKPAPDFQATAMVDGAFKEVKLSGYRGKDTVLFPYTSDFTFVCPTEIMAFSEHAEDFHKLGCEVLGVSKNSQFTHLAWTKNPSPHPPHQKEGGLGPLNIPLLADVTRSLSHYCGALKKDEGIAYWDLFIICGKGAFPLSPSKICLWGAPWMRLHLVQAFQYTDEQGEICPTGWKPGSDTVKPNMDDSKEYFPKHNYAEKQMPSLGPLPLPGCPGLAQERPYLALHIPQSVAPKG